MLPGFDHKQLSADGFTIDLVTAGRGQPLLLLHGFPETKAAWYKIAPRLATRYTVVLPDLPGYGDSLGPAPDAQNKNYGKRSIANVLVKIMNDLHFQRFAVAGHDRGGRVAYRMALDHSQKVTQLAVLNILPTLDMLEHLDINLAIKMENWFFLSQPAPYPETMIKSNTAYFLQYILDSWSEDPSMITAEARAEYLRCFNDPRVVASICAEYRALHFDAKDDDEDRKHSRRIQCPTCVLWSKEGLPSRMGDPLMIWKKWADNVIGTSLHGGHFLMEENPEEVFRQLSAFFKH